MDKPFEKVIFLDFDGPLINDRTMMGGTGISEQADPVMVNLLKRAGQAGIKIVVTSDRRTRAVTALGFLEELGLKKFLHDNWCTPVITHSMDHLKLHSSVAVEEYRSTNPDCEDWTKTHRGEEIDAWLKNHPEVRLYRIVDDDPSMLPGQMPWFVQCSSVDGLLSSEMRFLHQWILEAEFNK